MVEASNRSSENDSEPLIGIDLGTKNSCVGLLRGENVEILTNQQGRTITPSCVAFRENQEIVVG